MARRIITQTWPVQDLSAVCSLQDTAGAAALILNGTLASPLYPNTPISFLNAGFIRSFSITSTNDLSAVNFTVTGTQNGALVQTIVAGPNATTIESSGTFPNDFYDIITSITVDNAVMGVTVGTGDSGYLPLIQFNVANFAPFWAFSWVLAPAPNITYSTYQALEEIANNGTSFANLASFFPLTGNQTTSQVVNNIGLINYFITKITASTAPLTDTINLTFMQQ